jgi:membrane protein DedA with SNARE-associated domain
LVEVLQYGGDVPIPTDLASFLELVRQHGDAAYTIVFSYAASHSMLFTLVAVCWIGSFAGDAVRFWIGRRFGMMLFARFPRLARSVDIVVRLAERHHVWMILLHRYPHGIRGVAGFAYGMSPMPWSTFLALNFVAAGLWACAVVSVGFAFGQVSEKLMSDASSGLGVVMLIAFLGLSWVLSKKLERVAERN